jgi:hypothetical protein
MSEMTSDWPGTPLLEDALARYDVLYRVALDDATSVGAEATLVADGKVAVEVVTTSDTGDFRLHMPSTGSTYDTTAARTGVPVDVYIDGSFLQTAELRGGPHRWQVRVTAHDGLPVVIETDRADPVRELTLARVTPNDLGL